MSDLYWLTDDQMECLRPFFPKSHGRPRVDDRRVLSGIIFGNGNGPRWRDAVPEIRSTQSALQPLVSYGDIRPHDGGTGYRQGRASDNHD